MHRKTKVKIQKIFQAIYLLTFFITTIGICGNIELEVKTSLHCWFLFLISGILTITKMMYHSIKYPNSKYVWH